MTDTQRQDTMLSNSDPENCFKFPEEVEEEAKIKKIDFYRRSFLKISFYYFFSILTLGMVALLAKWKLSFRIFFKYYKASQDDAEYLIITGHDSTQEHVRMKTKSLHITDSHKQYRIFEYRLYTYYLDPEDQIFKPIQFLIKDKTYEQMHREFGRGIISTEMYQQRVLTYGDNSTDIPMKSNLKILIDEILSPFYVFQVFSVILWFSEKYVIYACVIIIISGSSIIMSFLTIKRNYLKLREKAHFETTVQIYRASALNENPNKLQPMTVSSLFLVPGDIIEIPDNQNMPCDILLLKGTCVMNESMLTGESVPIIKHQLPVSGKMFNANEDGAYILFAGTKCLEMKKNSKNDTAAIGVVIKSGFSTMKGKLIRSLLYGKPENFKFYRDSTKYIAGMAAIAVICFLFSLHAFIQEGATFFEILKKSLDVLTIAVPPALATCLSIGSEIASGRLEEKGIITKSQTKINVAGRVDVMCFDKTGTLTEDSLDLYGVKPMDRTENDDVKFLKTVKKEIHHNLNKTQQIKTLSHMMLELMATCHSLTFVRGVISGDPLDLKMFNATGWSMEDSHDASSEHSIKSLGIMNPPAPVDNDEQSRDFYYNANSYVSVIKRFDFVAKLQRMSAIIRDHREEKQRIYVKGSPEMVKALCREETLPETFSYALSQYTQNGLRVIACATRSLEADVQPFDNLEREDYEKDLEFLGFIVFENRLKPATTGIINKLNWADIKTVMLTGDNPLTAIFIARTCNILDGNRKVMLGVVHTSEEDSSVKQLEWQCIEPCKIEEKDEFLAAADKQKDDKEETLVLEMMPIQVDGRNAQENGQEVSGELTQRMRLDSIYNDNSIDIAMTGEALTYIKNTSQDPALYKTILRKAKVFARMRPDEKALVVEEFQAQDRIVGMCGDGANDCPALKAANIGVSLSEAEASIAAPFLSKISDISCIDIVLREGRAALSTSFQCFKYMSMYSFIQTISVVALYSRKSCLTDGSYLYIDLFLILPLAITMSYTPARTKLSKMKPSSSLFSLPILASMIGQFLIQAIFQIIFVAVLISQNWYQNSHQIHPGKNDLDIYSKSYDSTGLFLMSNFQYIAVVMAFSVGRPFRRAFYTNPRFVVTVLLTTIITIIMVFVTSDGILDFMDLMNIPGGFRGDILAFGIINSIATIVYEKYAVPWVVRKTIEAKKRKYLA